MSIHRRCGAPFKPGAEITASRRAVCRSGTLCNSAVSVCLFDHADTEIDQHSLDAGGDGLFTGFVEGPAAQASTMVCARKVRGLLKEGDRFDPSKLLVDPYATRLDRPFSYDQRLALFGEDTASSGPQSCA
jgi:glycogen operon protein